MKKNLHYISFSLLLVGVLFKAMHWPGANIMLMISIAITIFSTLTEFGQLDSDNKAKRVQIAMTVFIAAALLGAIFKIFHWPGADFIVRVVFNLSVPTSILFYFFNHSEQRLSKNLVAGIFYLVLLLMIFSPSNPVANAFQRAHEENVQNQQEVQSEPAH
jgi:CDP-diglyceride synthetase